MKDIEGIVCFKVKGNLMLNRLGLNGWLYKLNLLIKRIYILFFFLKFLIYSVFCYKF